MKGGSNWPPPPQKKLGGNPERGPTLAQRQNKEYSTYELSGDWNQTTTIMPSKQLLCWSLFLIKLQALFSCEICKNFMNTFSGCFRIKTEYFLKWRLISFCFFLRLQFNTCLGLMWYFFLKTFLLCKHCA